MLVCTPLNVFLLFFFRNPWNVPNLLRFGQVDPQLPPGGEFLPVAEVVCHLLASIAGHQRRAVLAEFVRSLHDSGQIIVTRFYVSLEEPEFDSGWLQQVATSAAAATTSGRLQCYSLHAGRVYDTTGRRTATRVESRRLFAVDGRTCDTPPSTNAAVTVVVLKRCSQVL